MKTKWQTKALKERATPKAPVCTSSVLNEDDVKMQGDGFVKNMQIKFRLKSIGYEKHE